MACSWLFERLAQAPFYKPKKETQSRISKPQHEHNQQQKTSKLRIQCLLMHKMEQAILLVDMLQS